MEPSLRPSIASTSTQTRKRAGWIAVASVGAILLVLLLFGVQRLRTPASMSSQSQGEIVNENDAKPGGNGPTAANPDGEPDGGATNQDTAGEKTDSKSPDGSSTSAGDADGFTDADPHANADPSNPDGVERDSSTPGTDVTTPAQQKAYIRVDLDPPGDVLADGRVVAQRTRRAIVEVPPGSVRDIVARHPELGEFRWSRVAAKPDTAELSHTFPWSEIVLRWTPAGSGTVYLDRVLAGTRESVRQMVAPGTHRIGVSRRGFRLRQAQHHAGAEAGTQLSADPGWNARMQTFLVETKLRRSTEIVFEFEPE